MTEVDPSAATAAEDGKPAASGAPGQNLGRYRLDKILGSGGMGIVWAAFDPDLERSVAIKVLRCADSEMTLRSRLLREARAMARLKHPGVLTVYEVGTDQNRDFIAMELVDGDNLNAWLETKPPRPEILAALVAAGQGLAAAHAAGLVHRDFKPHNVLRSNDGHVYVTDFGLARGQIEDGCELEQCAVPALPEELATGSQPRRPRDSVLDSPLTQTGVMIGTPAYMAPEQFAGRIPDPRSDQFAFCVTAWEALTGARPFRGSTLAELEAAAGGGVQALAVDLPPRIRAVLARGLDPSPEARWPDMPALLGALSDAIAPPRRPIGRYVLVGLSAAAVLAGAIVALAEGGSDNGPRAATRLASAEDCEPPNTAFDPAWSSSHKRRLVEIEQPHNKHESAGAAVLLDEVRGRWIELYRATCSAPKSDTRTARLACLREVRATTSSVVARLIDPEVLVRVTEIVALVRGVMRCDASKTKGIGERIDEKLRDELGEKLGDELGEELERELRKLPVPPAVDVPPAPAPPPPPGAPGDPDPAPDKED